MSNILKTAIKDEKDAIPMYQKVRSQVTEKDKQKIDKIISDERKHKKVLEHIQKRSKR